jgi:hypothetical protein
MAKVIEFLATDLSDYVTGAVIPIDGGFSAGRIGCVGIALSWRAHCSIKAAQILYRKYTFGLYSGDERATSKSLIWN